MTSPLADRLGQLRGIAPARIDLGLDRIARVLRALGNPQDKLPPTVHVAGTNGKGSTVAFLDRLLREVGYTCHRFTSPGVTLMADLDLAGTRVDQDGWAKLLKRVLDANGDQPLTEFEGLTAAAFLAMAETPADFALVECGMGGREDATNVLGRSVVVSAITCISMDHTEFLGRTIEQVAAHKAGILRKGVRAVIGPQLFEEPEAVLLAEAEAVGTSHTLVHGRDWHVEQQGENFVYTGPLSTLYLPLPSLPGPHQMGNAGTALTALGLIGTVEITTPEIGRALTDTIWPGRLERIRRGPLLAPFIDAGGGTVPEGWSVWIDGGHNDSAGEALALWAEATADQGPLHMIVGMLSSKNPRRFLEPIGGLAATLRSVPLDQAGRPAHSARVMLEYARAAGIRAIAPYTSIDQALTEIAQREPPGRVLLTGSLALIGPYIGDGGPAEG